MNVLAKLMCGLVALGVVAAGWAVEVTPEQAQTAVRNWIRKDPRSLTAYFAKENGVAKTYSKDGKALFHVIQLDGGGFVVTSGDTRVSPIVAFSDGGSFDDDSRNPLFALLNRDMAGRLDSVTAASPVRKKMQLMASSSTSQSSSFEPAKTENEEAWDELLATPGVRIAKSISSSSQLGDVRVEPMLKTEWDQSTWGNYNNTPDTFNKETPGHSVCGCVATAGAQIMNFWQHPKDVVPQTSCKYIYNGNVYTTTIGGGKYAWSSMPVAYSKSPSISAEQISAVGRLTYEVGVASSMSYTKGNSGTRGCIMMRSLKNIFGYKSAVGICTDYDIGTGINEDIRNCILASLDAGMPGTIGVFSETAGHEIVTDGYGFKGNTLYVHLNCGWSGSQNAWYQLFGEKLTSHNFYNIGEVCFNIHPTLTGDVVSGRVLRNDGRPVSKANVTVRDPAGNTKTLTANDKGIYFFRVTSTGQYKVKASYSDGSSVQSSKEASVVFSKLSQTSRRTSSA